MDLSNANIETTDLGYFHIAGFRRDVSADRIRQARRACGYHQQEIADRLGKDRSTVSKYENNIGCPSVDDYLQMARLYGEPVEWLMAIDIVRARGVKV